MNDIRFYLEERKGSTSAKVPLVLSYWFNGIQLKYYTGIQVTKGNYNKEYWKITETNKKVRKPIKPNEPRASALNTKLELMAQKVTNLHTNAEALNKPLTVNYFKDQLDITFKGKGENTEATIGVARAYNEYLDFLKLFKANTTFKKHLTTNNHLMEMIGKKYKDLSFDQVNNKLVEAFRIYLVNKGFVLNTVVKYLNSLRDFLSWCKDDKRGYFNGKIKFDIKEEDIELIFLSQAEVDKLEKADMPNSTLEKVRDMYLFGCYTGMRYGDLNNLKNTDFKGDHIEFIIGKGGKTTTQSVPLLPTPLRLIEKYKNKQGDKLLPMFSNQKMNQYVKEVMKIAEINELMTKSIKMGTGKIKQEVCEKHDLITFHTSRKSFITIAINNKMPESVIKSITGHSKDSKAFKKYYKISEDLKRAEMVRVFNNSSTKLKAV
jgi:integrase